MQHTHLFSICIILGTVSNLELISWWHMPAIPVLRRLMQKDYKLETSLGCIVSFRPALSLERELASKQASKEANNTHVNHTPFFELVLSIHGYCVYRASGNHFLMDTKHQLSASHFCCPIGCTYKSIVSFNPAADAVGKPLRIIPKAFFSVVWQLSAGSLHVS